ncbi:cupin domain-containing protein [Nigerium massiliense]|uniref:cupin domain-containing protein n=1 Tax=Nigerium massiliense TaxID=1522317 RepID=UPI0012FD6408|nr:cupin domain-containing protein [Nigerium massiliense]
MRVIDLAQIPRMEIDQYGSRGFHWGWLTREGHMGHSVARLEPGGRIGRHPTVGNQLMIVVAGVIEASGEDGHGERVEQGQAVVWDHGEQHATVATSEGALLVLIEGAFATWPDTAQVPTAQDLDEDASAPER